jgi:hypothetical protein
MEARTPRKGADNKDDIDEIKLREKYQATVSLERVNK